MDWANGLAGKSWARWLWPVFGLMICAADSGCARLRSFRSDATPPMLGAADRSRAGSGGKTAGGGDLYADRVRGRKPAAESLLDESSSPARPGAARSLDVALQPPVTV